MSELIRTQKPMANRLTVIAVVLVSLLLFLGLYNAVAAAAAIGPILDLNGSLPGREFVATYTEDEGRKAIVNPTGLTITNEDSATLAWARVTLQTVPDGALEQLNVDPGLTGIKVLYKPAVGVLDLTGDKSLEDYQQVLRTITYVNASQGPDTSDRIVLFELNDGTTRSEPITATVTINAVNDAPILDNTGTMMLADINENVFNSLGNRVETIIASAGGDAITDPDKDALEGMAIIDLGTSNGAWQYSLDAGATWLTFPTVSNESAVLLNTAARVRFVPKPQFSGLANFTFRAWDQTQGANGDTAVDVTKNGGTTAFSLATETVTINVVAVNDPPVVDLNGPEDGVNFSAGYLGSNVPIPLADQDATVSDPDSQTLTQATFKLTNPADGMLESLSADVTTTNITITPYDPVTGELILNGPDTLEAFQKVLRTANYINSAVTPSSGPRIIEITVNDGASSSAVATTTIQINPNNQAPVLSAPSELLLAAVAEDTINPPGNTVAAILASNGDDPITDPDANALEGIAIVGADNSHGQWQYAGVAPSDGTPAWQPAGVVSETAAILLNTEALIRFVPSPDYAGPSGSLTIRAWDQTSGTNGQRNVNVTVNGGSTAFSAETAVASLTVTAINDPPIIDYAAGNPLLYQEDAAPLPLLTGSLVITDVDSANLASALITLVNRPDGDAEVLAVTPGASGITTHFESGVLQLSGSASVDAYRQVLATLTYVNLSQDPDEADRQVQIVVNDGKASSLPLPLMIGVLAVNDPPIVDLNGNGPGTDFSTNFFIQWRPARITDPNMVIVDQDDTSLISVTARLVNMLDGEAESLAARVVGTNIKQKYDPTTGVLALSGVDSVSNYQQVIRSVTYNNVLESPSLDMRTVTFQAHDGTEFGPLSETAINIQPTPMATLLMPMIGRRSEEPNDVCAEALAAAINRDESYYTGHNDNDWYYFDLTSPATVVVRLSNFLPGGGQLIVASGASCATLNPLGNNGDDEPNKVVNIGRRPAGRYYIWIINDGAPGTSEPYTLRIDATP